MQENMDIYDGNTGYVYADEKERREHKQQKAERVERDGASFAVKTYGFMTGGLITSFAVALVTSLFFPATMFDYEFYLAVMIGELVVAMIFAFTFAKLSPVATGVLFFVYAILTGFSLSLFTVGFGFKTFYLAFGITGAMFLALTIVGLVTKKDTSRIGPTLSVMLIALAITSVLAFIIGGVLEMIVCAVGVILFGAVTVYDTKKVRQFASYAMTTSDESKYAIYSAMQLYLDYINILLYLLRLLGFFNKRR